MTMTFKIVLDDDQERDLRETAQACGLSPADLIAAGLLVSTFNTPVKVEEEKP